MASASNNPPFDGAWDVFRRQELEPLSKEDGYRWGLSQIEYVKKEILRLEERALARRDADLLHGIVDSKLRAMEVERELQEKLNSKQ